MTGKEPYIAGGKSGAQPVVNNHLHTDVDAATPCCGRHCEHCGGVYPEAASVATGVDPYSLEKPKDGFITFWEVEDDSDRGTVPAGTNALRCGC